MSVPRAVLLLCGFGAAAPHAAAQHVEHLDSLRARIGLPPLGPVTAPDAFTVRAAGAAARGAAVAGDLRVVMVPALFADSPEPATAPDYLQQLFFGDGPTTLSAFYEEASGGALTVTGAAAPWVRTSVTRLDATGDETNVLGIGPAFGAWLLEALDSADVHLDFRQFDNDGPDGIPDSGDDNGVVDGLVFMFVEVSRSCGGDGVWPHFSGISPRNVGEHWASTDTGFAGTPITADPYLIVSASSCDGTPETRVAVVAHELGHRLGQPDIYHVVEPGLEGVLPERRRWVLGCFDIMAGGAWGCGPVTDRRPFGPTQFSPWTLQRLGWIDLETVGAVRYTTFTLPPVRTSHRVLEVPLDAAGRESFLIEYRLAAGFDVDLPASGVLIYRHDRDTPFKPDPAGTRHYQIEVLEADADSALVRTHLEGGDRGVATDVFATGGAGAALSNTTIPSTRRANGALTPVTIHSITVENGNAVLVVSTAETPGVIVSSASDPVAAAEPLAIELPVGGGAQPYTVTLGAGTFPPGLSATITGDGLMLGGAPEQTGAFQVSVRVTDARGVTGTTPVPLDVRPAALDDAALIAALARGTGLSDAARRLLDNDGNRNGRLDTGDLRAWLRRTRVP